MKYSLIVLSIQIAKLYNQLAKTKNGGRRKCCSKAKQLKKLYNISNAFKSVCRYVIDVRRGVIERIIEISLTTVNNVSKTFNESYLYIFTKRKNIKKLTSAAIAEIATIYYCILLHFNNGYVEICVLVFLLVKEYI